MFSQSFNCLPNKKQSIFSNQPPSNMALLRNLTSTSFQDNTDQIDLSMNFEVSKKNNCISSRTNIGLMDIVYSFKDTSSIKFGSQFIPAYPHSNERSKLNSKDLVSHYNTMTTSPLVRSYLVGGFVGSKSQLGRRRKNDVGRINLWDIIRDLVDMVGNASGRYHKQDHPTPSLLDKASKSMQNGHMYKDSSCQNNHSISNHNEEPSKSSKQSYADVAKRPVKDHPSFTPSQPKEKNSMHSLSSENCDTKTSVIEPSFPCSENDFTNRDRITSECSADSEDSFIVFECCEDDNIEKDSCSSDDETLSCLDEVSQSDSGIVPSSNSSVCCKQLSKKVRFAEGESLAKVHPMVAWDYAYRSARRGPWEMLARDSERFKLRIARTEAVLKPILDPQHRSVVYRDRFSDPDR